MLGSTTGSGGSSSNNAPSMRLSQRPLIVQLEYAMYFCYIVYCNIYGLQRMYFWSRQDAVLDWCRPRLAPAWFMPDTFLGYDRTDGQLGSFLANLPALTLALAAYVGISRSVRVFAPQYLVAVHCVLNTCYLLYFHGASALFVFFFMGANYAWTLTHKALPFWLYNLIAWVAQIAILFVNDAYKGYTFASIAPALAGLDAFGHGAIRWYIVFNMSTLRMLGFNYDVWEASQRSHDEVKEAQEAKHRMCVDCAEAKAPCYKLRCNTPRPTHEYNFWTYFAYITYIPLYIGGPLSSFNAYMSHLQQPQSSFDTTKLVRYLCRIVGLYVTLIALVHVAYINCLRHDLRVVAGMSMGDMMAYGNLFLAFLWLKLNMIWKFFRIVGLCDGVEAPEDMNRCFSNTTTVTDFWRDWHSSFNLWIVRYMYVPMGGTKLKYLAIFPIFLFIALWHDIELHLLWWAGIMCAFFVPEMAVVATVPKKFPGLKNKPYYRHVRAVGGVITTSSLVIANMFGFGTGETTKGGVSAMVNYENGVAVCVFLFYIFSANQFAIYSRQMKAEEEQRRRVACGLDKAN